ncbi:class II aldolase [Nakamurella silvestris]|nr:class II aldolase [Nakamurella silvestris]
MTSPRPDSPGAVWDPSQVSDELLTLTHSLGDTRRDLVILAEGNTSALLPDGRVVVKASGSNMASATREDFVVVDVPPLIDLITSQEATQQDLTEALVAGEHEGRLRRASIETLVHVAVQHFAPAAYVGHTHPTTVVGLLASVHAETAFEKFVYSDEAVVIGRPLFVPYAQPGIDLGRVFFHQLRRYFEQHGELPSLILLGNHGIVAVAPSPQGVEGISAMSVKGAAVRIAAYSAGGAAPLSDESITKFFARDDIAERRHNLASGS